MKKKILSLTKKDFIVTYYKDSGAGGQKRNKTETGVRIQHLPSGALATNCETRSQTTNKWRAWKTLTDSPKFRLWLTREIFGTQKTDKELEDEVNKAMRLENLKIEFLVDGEWMIVK